MSYQPSTGHKMKFYRNSGTIASPTWVEISQIGDLSIPDFARSLAELKRRGNDFVKNLAGLIQTITVQFKMPFGLDNTNFTLLRNAFLAGTNIQYAVMNDDIAEAGSEGLVLPGILKQFPWDQPLEEVSSHDIQIATGFMLNGSGAEVDPTWLTVED